MIGVVNRISRPQDVVVCAAGSMPGDLHKLWRTRDRKGYHVEYGFSCMGYEIAGGLGVKLAAPRRRRGPRRRRHGRRRVVPDDGAGARHRRPGGREADRRARAEPRLRLDRGALGVTRVAALRHPLPLPHRATGLDGDVLPVDLAANAASLGAHVIRVTGLDELEKALAEAQAADATTVIHVETDPTGAGTRQPRLVGRSGGRDLGAGRAPARPARPTSSTSSGNATTCARPTRTDRGDQRHEDDRALDRRHQHERVGASRRSPGLEPGDGGAAGRGRARRRRGRGRRGRRRPGGVRRVGRRRR